MKYTVEVDREGCISCATCYSMDYLHFQGDSEGKSQVIGGTTNGKSVGSFDDDKVAEAEAAADSCPVSVITVTRQSQSSVRFGKEANFLHVHVLLARSLAVFLVPFFGEARSP